MTIELLNQELMELELSCALNLSLCLLKMRRYVEARTFLQTFLREGNHADYCAKGYLRLARAWLGSADYPEAEHCARAARSSLTRYLSSPAAARRSDLLRPELHPVSVRTITTADLDRLDRDIRVAASRARVAEKKQYAGMFSSS